MLKKFILLALALSLLTIPTSLAASTPLETRDETIMLEGMEENITTVRFESPRGYAFWYDPTFLAPQESTGSSDMDIFLRPDFTDDSYSLSIHYGSWIGYSFDEAKLALKMALDKKYDNVESPDGPSPIESYPCQQYAAQRDDLSVDQYVINQGDGAFYICLTYPSEAAEGFGDRVHQMLESFEILPKPESQDSSK